MSKITSKNLHYDDSLPPFLARLRANHNAGDGRHEYTVARPKKARTAEDEAEDEPVYFNEESGETLTKSEWEAGLEVEGEGEGRDGEKVEGGDESIVKGDGAKEKVALIGASRKRKAGKVVGGEEEDGNEQDVAVARVPRDKIAEVSSQPGKKIDKTAAAASQLGKKSEKGKQTNKGKKIKLSFGDDD